MADLTPKMLVAVELLDRSVQMYNDKAYFAAIHLAGAAEELFGRYLELSREAKPAADTICDDVVVTLGYSLCVVPPKLKKAIYETIYRPRNRTKHLNDEGDHDISFDPKQEAETSLHRAINNCLEMAIRSRVEVPLRVHQFCDDDG